MIGFRASVVVVITGSAPRRLLTRYRQIIRATLMAAEQADREPPPCIDDYYRGVRPLVPQVRGNGPHHHSARSGINEAVKLMEDLPGQINDAPEPPRSKDPGNCLVQEELAFRKAPGQPAQQARPFRGKG